MHNIFLLISTNVIPFVIKNRIQITDVSTIITDLTNSVIKALIINVNSILKMIYGYHATF
ncbi:MAG: hypothetical protein BGO48_06580 [Mucilaginibacter sp. 44-25]|nr:MAG: hypothetical protein BGO48_06580 [Mucilaginibacter sp. 44-25]